MMVSASTCGKMANTPRFVTLQTWTSETLAVPGRTYVMEFEVGYQTASNSIIKCQGESVLMNVSIQKGVVQHTEFVITIEEEIFQKQQDKVLAMSSSQILNCSPHGPDSGCFGALHTYTLNPPETACTFKIIRKVQGIHTPQYFVADKSQLFYKFKGSQNLPISCGRHKVHVTNVKDNLLLQKEENTEVVKLLDIRPQDVSNAAELHSLSLYLRYKLDLSEGKRSAIGAKMSCQASVSEPSDAPPHHLGSGTFVFKSGEVIYQYSCEKVNVKLMEKDMCYADIPFEANK